MNVYALKDEFVGFDEPRLMNSDEEAIRALKLSAMDDTTLLGKCPQDYAIYKIGTFNKETGELTPEQPTLLARASSLVRKGTDEV